MSIPYMLLIGGVVVTLLAILLFAFSGSKRVKVPIVVAVAIGGLALGAALGVFATSPDGDDLPYVSKVTPGIGMGGGALAVLAIGLSFFARTWRFKASATLAGGIGGLGLGVSLGIAAMSAYSDAKPVNENDLNITSNPITNAERNAQIEDANSGAATKGGGMRKGMAGGGLRKDMGGGATPKDADGGAAPPDTNDPVPTPKN